MRNIIQGTKTTWIDILKPAGQDVDFLREQYHFPDMVLDQLIPRSYHPRLEVGQDYLFLIINHPTYHEMDHDVTPRELDIILTKNALVTNHGRPLFLLENFFKTCRRPEIEGEKYLDKGPGYVLFSILDIFWRDCLAKLDRINEDMEKTEKKMFHGKEKEMVREISHIKTDVIDFWRIIEPQLEIMKLLEKDGPKFFGEELSLHFSGILGNYEKIWQTVKALKETIFAMEKTNQSLLTTKTNEIIKVLTIFSVIMMPLTLLASIWGMNLRLPFGEHPFGFLFVAAIMAVVLAGMFTYFRKKGWL